MHEYNPNDTLCRGDGVLIIKKNENMFLLFLIQIKGCYALDRIKETKLVCAISRKLMFGLFCFGALGIGGTNMVLKWIQNGRKIISK